MGCRTQHKLTVSVPETGPAQEASQLRHFTGCWHGDKSSCAGCSCHEEEANLSNSKGQQVLFGDNMATGEVCDG